MQEQLIEQWNQDGYQALTVGDLERAGQAFTQVIKLDEENIFAWYCLGKYVISSNDQTERNKCLDKARLAAIQSEESLRYYYQLLLDTGTPTIPIYVLQPTSASVGARCPLTAVTFKPGDKVVVCPGCNAAHDVDAWEFNGYECAACGVETALIDRNAAMIPQPPRRQETVVVGEADIAQVDLGPSREEQDDAFRQQLERHAARQILGALFVDAMRHQAREEQRRAEEARQRQAEVEQARALRRQIISGFLFGCIPAVLLGLATYQLTESWLGALFIALLVVWSVIKASILSTNRDINPLHMLYALFPQLCAISIFVYTLGIWEADWLAAIIAYLCGVILGGWLIRQQLIYRFRGAFVFIFSGVVVGTYFFLHQAN